MADQKLDFEAIFCSGLQPQAVLGPAREILVVNDAFCSSFGRSRDALLGADLLEILPNDAALKDEAAAACDTAIAGLGASAGHFSLAERPLDDPNPMKSEVWWALSFVPLASQVSGGRTVLMYLEDVTAQSVATGRQDMFAREVQHRIGNVLTLAQIIARKTAKSSGDLDAFVTAYDDRIRVLGNTHAFLSKGHWDGMTLRQVIETQMQSHLHERSGIIRIDGPEVQLSVLHTQTFAMAIHELFSNASAYGALAISEGEVDVHWDHPIDGGFTFSWTESGLVGLEPPVKSGFGMQMMTKLLPGQLSGSAVCEFRPTGLHYSVSVPFDASIKVGRSVSAADQRR